MFAPLSISIDSIRKLYQLVGDLRGADINIEKEGFYQRLLDKCTNTEGTIDGSNLQSLVFPFDKTNYDVFISHSHADQDFAMYLYTWLRSCGLNCFIDEVLWYSADELLKKIDHEYCKSETPGLINYNKSLLSSGHVHTMLGMAMLEAINRSECCLFVKSDNSLTLKKGIEEKTLSPWIYQEVQYANHLRPILPPRLQKSTLRLFSEGGSIICESQDFERAQNSLKIEYKVDFTNFKEINHADLFSLRGKGAAGLDIIYKKYFAKSVPLGYTRKYL